jgi:hypothetical protein
MKRHYLILIMSSIITTHSLSQDYPRKPLDPSYLVDEIFATQELEINYQELYENYMQLISTPLNLNKVTEEQLKALYILNPQQTNALLAYREEAGPFLSVYELQNVEGFTKDVFLKLIPFVSVEEESNSFNKNLLKRIASEKNNYLLIRYSQTLEEQAGYSEKTDSNRRYVGSPANFYARFRTSRPGDFSLGFTVEKDAGERFSWNPAKKTYGFDYISIHAQTLNKGKIKNLILGDYQAQFGQGIVLGSAFGIGKNAEAVTTIRRSNLGFLPYTSLYEAGYFRGMALSYQVTKKFTVHAMASTRGRDGNLKDTTQSAVSSFNFSGLHRTPSEIANRNATQETNLAAVATYKNRSLEAGAVFHTTKFSLPLSRKPNAYNQFQFNGSENTNTSIFLNYSIHNVTLFSELAQTVGFGHAVVAGMLASATPKLDVSFLYRSYDRNFYSFYSNAIAENSVAQNESGFYWGWKYSFNKKYSLSGYADLFVFPWLKSRSYAPSEGSEWLLRFNYRPSKNVYLFLQAREENKQRNTGEDFNLYITAMGTRRNYWINIDYSVLPSLQFKSRAQFSTFQFAGNTTQGTGILQDFSYHWGRLTFSGRYVLFDTDNFDNRLFVYEQDVWLAFSFPAYSDTGVRHFLLAQYKATDKIDFWLRWAQTRYADRETIGSGGETILGNRQNDIRLQARIRF